MRTISYGVSLISIVALAVIAVEYPTPTVLGLCMAALALCLGLPMFVSLRSMWASAAVAVGLTFAAGWIVATERLWIDGVLAIILALVPTLIVGALVRWSWVHTTKVWWSEVLLLTNPLLGGLRAVFGPDRVLLHPFVSVLARLPTSKQEFHLDLTGVNAMPRAGPYGLIPWNIRQMRVEFTFQLYPGAYRKIFQITNQGEVFQTAARSIGKHMPNAMRERAFWVEAWQLAITQIAEQAIREEIHASGLSPLEVSQYRTEIADRIWNRMDAEMTAIDLELTDCTIQQVEPDETEASLRSRESFLLAQSRAAEFDLAGERITALMVRMAEVHRASQGTLPTELLETLIMSVLPINSNSTSRIRADVRSYDRTARFDDHPLVDASDKPLNGFRRSNHN